MSTTSSIEWTDKTWNPVRGCSKVSAGCTNCYAMKVAHRFSGPGKPYEGLTKLVKGKGPQWTGAVKLVPEALDAPLRWRKPAKIFVNSMSDLFHEGVPDHFIDDVFGVMWACLYVGRGGIDGPVFPGHVFQILTKRPERMAEYMAASDLRERWARAAVHFGGGTDPDGIADQVFYFKGPHPRIWLGTSIENQEAADERIPHLLRVPAAVRFLSCEPLLGPVDLSRLLSRERCGGGYPGGAHRFTEYGREVCCPICGGSGWKGRSLEWAIIGGESGPGARPFNIGWASDLVAQCRAAGVAPFVKQLGAQPFVINNLRRVSMAKRSPGGMDWRKEGSLTDSKGGDMAEWPEDLRVREFPEVSRG